MSQARHQKNTIFLRTFFAFFVLLVFEPLLRGYKEYLIFPWYIINCLVAERQMQPAHALGRLHSSIEHISLSEGGRKGERDNSGQGVNNLSSTKIISHASSLSA